MCARMLAKVMKYELRYLDGCGSFSELQERLWWLQRQTREILNRTIQIAADWDFRSRENFERCGEYLDLKAETGYNRLDGYVYDRLKDSYNGINAQNLNATLRKAWQKYHETRQKVMRGEMSLPSYKSGQPLVLNRNTVKILGTESGADVTISLFSRKYLAADAAAGSPRFQLLVKDGTQRSILSRVLSGEYEAGQSQIVYDKKKWFLLLTYRFEPERQALDPDRILGVDLGEAYALYASSLGERGAFKIEGGQVTGYAAKLEGRVRELQRQAAHCGDGRVGHGVKSRVSSVYKAKDKVAGYRSMINHQFSKALVAYAEKNGYGTIQMEDLTGIKEDAGYPKKLRHWTYYDLQTKIEYKAKERGIAVRRVNPAYTSKRCSRCGHIDKQNRKSQENFECVSCGFKANADYNASQNLSIKDIDKIIERQRREAEADG